MTKEYLLPNAPPLTLPYAVIDDFLPIDLAMAMRADIDAHFANPDKHRPETHQVWNYWYVPGAYTYLRTSPDKVIDPGRVNAFIAALRTQSIAILGLADVTWPYLSAYINGCSQALHNDSLNGRFGYVYSLTKPARRTIGGETILVDEGDPFRRNLRSSTTLEGFGEFIEPRFNRLLIFDDRLIHAVERVAGSMDPVEGRLVLHGHIREGGPVASGALPVETLEPIVEQTLNRFVAAQRDEVCTYHGPISVQFIVDDAGTVVTHRVILDRVTHLSGQAVTGWPQLREKYLAALTSIRFPSASGPTTVILPFVFPGP